MQTPLKKIQLAHVYNKATLFLFFFFKDGWMARAELSVVCVQAGLMEE